MKLVVKKLNSLKYYSAFEKEQGVNKVLVEKRQADFIFEDERGKLVQLVHEGWTQVNVITSVKGCLRGGHYHKINKELFYIVHGSLNLILKKESLEENYIFKTGDIFIVGDHILHSFEFLEETVLVSMYDKGVELPNDTKDIYTV